VAQLRLRQRREERVQRADDRGAEPASQVQREVRAEQASVRPDGAASHQHAEQRARAETGCARLVPAQRPARLLQRPAIHRDQCGDEDGEPGGDQDSPGVDERRGRGRYPDRDQDRPGVPRAELRADHAARRRVGRQEGAREELRGAQHELRDAAEEEQVQGDPVLPPDAGRLGDRAEDGGREHERDARREEGGEQAARTRRARVDRAPAGTAAQGLNTMSTRIASTASAEA
jgi:hypothetical protein